MELGAASLLVSLCVSLTAMQSVALAVCFTESPFASACGPVSSATSPAGIRGCFRPDLQGSDESAGVSVVWDPATGACVRRQISCGSFAACSGRCLVSCDVATRGFLVLSLRAAVGVKSFDLIDTPLRSNSSVRGMSDAAQLPSVFRADVLDQLPVVQPLLTFKELVLSLFVSNSVVLNITFDLSQSPSNLTRTDWFSQARLKSSWPVTDLRSRNCNFFSVQGDGTRRFFIHFTYGACPGDAGMMVVLDAAYGCWWGTTFTAAPQFLYSTQPGTPYATNSQFADLMVIVLR